MTEAMSEERLAEIEARHRWYTPLGAGEAIDELLAEVRRTREAEAQQRLRADQLEELLGISENARNAEERNRRALDDECDGVKAALIDASRERDQLARVAEQRGALAAKFSDRLDAIGPRSDEYGIRTVYAGTLISEEPVADNLSDALRLVRAAEAKGRSDVVSREVIRREVGQWREIGEADRG